MNGIYDTGAPEPVPRSFNMAAYVLQHVTALSNKAAVEIHGAQSAEISTYGDIGTAVRQTGFGLLNKGLGPGDRILMRLGNTLEFPIVFLGALWAGLVPVPTSAALTQREVDWIAKDLKPKLCVGHAKLPKPDGVPLSTPETLMSPAEQNDPHFGDPNRLGYIVYTSGSSGRPRAVAHAHRAIWARRMMYDGWYGLQKTDRVFHAGAFNWTYTLGVGLMDPWAMGATALIREDSVENSCLSSLLKRSHATIFAAAPGVYRQMLKGNGVIELPQLRHGLSAGEALPQRLRDHWFEKTGTEIYEALGMSECSTYISAAPGRQAPKSHAGYVQDGRRVTVLDADGTRLPFGSIGTLGIHKRDPGLMLGYENDPNATSARMKGEWFDTGDRAILRSDGAVKYLGRDDDMMNAGGYRVSPLEVEAAFAPLPGLGECAAVEVEVKADTRVIALFYTGPTVDADVLKAHADTALARYKQPRLYRHRSALPHNTNGKLNRKKLRADFEAEE